MGRTALSAAPKRRKSEIPPCCTARGRRRRAKCGACCAWTCGMGVSDARRFGAAERAVWPVGRAGTAGPLGLDVGPRAHFDQPLK
eukprot:14973916-Alexandrium_andersonii.AAC.1